MGDIKPRVEGGLWVLAPTDEERLLGPGVASVCIRQLRVTPGQTYRSS